MTCKSIKATYKTTMRKFLQRKFDNYLIKKTIETWSEEIYDEAQTYGWKLTMHDSGNLVFPRYEIQIEMPVLLKEIQDTGCYGLSEEKEKKLRQLHNRCRKLAHILGVYYTSNVSVCAIFWNKKDLEEAWNEEEN